MSNQPINEISCCNCGTCQAYIARMEERIARLEEAMKPVSTDIVYAGDADRADCETIMQGDGLQEMYQAEQDMQALDTAYEKQHRDRLHAWYDAAQYDWCTNSPTCTCSQCRLIEHNSNEAPEDQITDEDGARYIRAVEDVPGFKEQLEAEIAEAARLAQAEKDYRRAVLREDDPFGDPRTPEEVAQDIASSQPGYVYSDPFAEYEAPEGNTIPKDDDGGTCFF